VSDFGLVDEGFSFKWALRPTHSPIQRVLRTVFPGNKVAGVLTTNLYLVLKLPSTYTVSCLYGLMLNEAHRLKLFVFN